MTHHKKCDKTIRAKLMLISYQLRLNMYQFGGMVCVTFLLLLCLVCQSLVVTESREIFTMKNKRGIPTTNTNYKLLANRRTSDQIGSRCWQQFGGCTDQSSLARCSSFRFNPGTNRIVCADAADEMVTNMNRLIKSLESANRQAQNERTFAFNSNNNNNDNNNNNNDDSDDWILGGNEDLASALASTPQVGAYSLAASNAATDIEQRGYSAGDELGENNINNSDDANRLEQQQQQQQKENGTFVKQLEHIEQLCSELEQLGASPYATNQFGCQRHRKQQQQPDQLKDSPIVRESLPEVDTESTRLHEVTTRAWHDNPTVRRNNNNNNNRRPSTYRVSAEEARRFLIAQQSGNSNLAASTMMMMLDRPASLVLTATPSARKRQIGVARSYRSESGAKSVSEPSLGNLSSSALDDGVPITLDALRSITTLGEIKPEVSPEGQTVTSMSFRTKAGPMECKMHRFSFTARRMDANGNRCWGVVTARICYGGCDTGEIADWLFPHKKSIHKVCRHGARIKRLAILNDCSSPDVDESLRYYYYVDARSCVCQKCTSADTSCLGSMTSPYLPDGTLALVEE